MSNRYKYLLALPPVAMIDGDCRSPFGRMNAGADLVRRRMRLRYFREALRRIHPFAVLFDQVDQAI